MVLFIIVFCMLVALGFGIAAAVSDYKSMNIPNAYSIGIAAAFGVAYAVDAVSGDGVEFFGSVGSHLIAGVIIFAATFVLFALKIIGAGDSKLLSVFALWVGTPGLAALAFYMAMTGALLGLATKYLNKHTVFEKPAAGSWIAKAQNGGQGVPYGIAICIGAIAGFWSAGYFSLETLGTLAGAGRDIP